MKLRLHPTCPVGADFTELEARHRPFHFAAGGPSAAYKKAPQDAQA